MNGINRRDQKVVCVMQIDVEDGKGHIFPGPYPEVDKVYTVEDFVDSGMVRETGEDMVPGITLRELASIRGRRVGDGERRVMGWPIIAFRPLDERKTDIGDLVRAGQKVGLDVRRKVSEDA